MHLETNIGSATPLVVRHLLVGPLEMYLGAAEGFDDTIHRLQPSPRLFCYTRKTLFSQSPFSFFAVRLVTEQDTPDYGAPDPSLASL